MNCRNQFTFYKSFDDVLEDLTDNQLAVYIRTMLDVQFLRVKIDEVSFSDKLLNMIWKAQKHSIRKSVNGYLDSQKSGNVKTPYLGIYSPLQTPSGGVRQQVKGEEQVKEQVKEQEQSDNPKNDKPFSFSLKRLTTVDRLSKEYLAKLEAHIIHANRSLTYADFITGLEANGKKYKNFKSAYTTWANNKDKWDNKTPENNNTQGGLVFDAKTAMNLHNAPSGFTL